MSEVRREVWVLERHETPAWKYCSAIFKTEQEALDTALEGETPVRYIPEHSARESAQGEGWVAVEKVEAFATLLRQAAFMASQAGHADAARVYLDCERELKDSLLPPPPKAEGK